MADQPCVSVVITSFNHAHFLGRSIESATGQTYPCVETLVVDDGSHDNPGQVVRRYPNVGFVRQANRGASAARNAGWRTSTGEYLVFLDADDRLRPNALEAGVRCFGANPGAGFVYGRYTCLRGDGTLLPTGPPRPEGGDDYSALLQRNFIAMNGTVMFRRTVLESVGGYDTSLQACEDYDLYLRIAQKYPIGSHDELVAEYLRHEGNMSDDSRLMLHWLVAVLRRQSGFVRQRPQYQEAYIAGLQASRAHYGRRLALEINTDIARGQWLQAITKSGTLLRHQPGRVRELIALGLNAIRKKA
jgi:glycosyltransferase involved in cell wall biosynthesis